MIPISDADAVRRGRPVVNIALIAINALVFIYELSLSGLNQDIFFYKYGLIAAELTSGETLKVIPFLTSVGVVGGDVDTPIPTWGTVFTSMFIHGGFMHFIANMLFLWVFGDNIEARLGHFKYLLFYLGAGIAAAWTQVAVDQDSLTPLIGASGAISGLLGAYLLLYPYNRPALYFLGFWFVLQLFNGLGSLSPAVSGAGVAYMAHVGGFASGVLFMAGYKLLLREPIWPRRPWGSWRY